MIRETPAEFLEVNSPPHKQGTGDPSGNSERAEEPTKAILTIGGDKRKVQSGGDGDLELTEGHDDRLHTLRRLGESVLEGGDGRKDFANANENIRTRDDPDIDGGCEWVAVGVSARGGEVVVAWAHLVEVMLKNTCVDHRSTNDHETSRNALDRAEIDTPPAQEWVDDVVKDGDEDDDRDGVQVLDQIVGSAVESHGCSHCTVVAVNLRVAEPEDRGPQEDLACRDGTRHFADELIVPGEILWTGLIRVRRW